MVKITRAHYAALYGPTTGDAVRLGDTSLQAEIEHEVDGAVGGRGDFEDVIELFVVGHVAGFDHRGAERLDEFPESPFHPGAFGIPVGEVSEPDLGSLEAERLRLRRGASYIPFGPFLSAGAISMGLGRPELLWIWERYLGLLQG